MGEAGYFPEKEKEKGKRDFPAFLYFMYKYALYSNGLVVYNEV